MDRYQLAKGLHKKLNSAPETSQNIESFGFDWNPERDSEVAFKKPYLYRPEADRPAVVGIVYKDPNNMFSGSNVHYRNGIFFLCKSELGLMEVCCQSSKPYRRIVCPIVVYENSSGSNFKVHPWVFGISVFNRLKEIHSIGSLGSHDFQLMRRDRTPYNQWEVSPLGRSSVWLSGGLKERVLKAAEPIFQHRREFLGKDLSPQEIKELLSMSVEKPAPQPVTTAPPQRRNPPERLRDDGEEFFEQLRASERTIPNSQRDSNRRINLDSILDSI